MKPWERYGSGGTPPGGGGPWSQYGGPADAEPAPAGRGVGGTLKDLGVGVVQGAVNLAGGLAELPNLATGGALDQNIVRPAQRALDRALGGPGADNGGISGGIARINEGLDAAASPTLKGRRQELAEAMDRGPLAAAGKVVTDPVLMGQFLAEQVPIIATLGAGSVGTAGRAAAAARAGGAGTKAAQKAGRTAVQRNLVGANVAMGAGFSGQEAQQRVADLPDEAWQANPEYVALAEQVGPDEAKRRLGVEAGQIAAAVAGPISGAVSRLTAPFEAQVFTRGLNTGLTAAVGKEAVEEAVQEGGEAFAANLGVQQRADPSQALGEGVLESAAVGGAVGGVLGGGLYGAGRLTRLNEDVQSEAELDAAPSIAGALPSPTIVPDPGDPAAAFEAQRQSMENAERSQQLYAERDAEVARREAAMQTLAANGIDPNAGPISKGVARLALTRAPIEASSEVDPARTFAASASMMDATARAEALYMERAAEETRRAAAMAGNLPAQILDPKTNGPFRSMPGLNAQRKKLGANADRYEVQKLGPRQWVLALKDDPNANPTDPSAPAESPVATGAENQETWQAFAPDTTLNVPRDVMPQVKSEHRGALVNFLKGRGVTAEPSQDVDPLTLQPSQMEFSPEKVARAKTFAGTDRAILVSSDNRVIDGHHQWLAKVDAGEPVSVIRINAPAEDVLPLVSEFPSSTVEQRSPKGLQDDRLSDEGLVVDLRAMAPEAGWAEIGGSIIRAGADGEVTGRTKWLPNAPWFPVVQRDARLPGNQAGRATQEAVRKAIAGEPMSAAERRHVEAMLDWAETEREDLTARGIPDADPFELAGALADADSDMPPRIVAMMDAVAQQDEAEAERLAIQYDDDAALEAALQEWLDGRRTQEADTRAASAEGGADLPRPDGSQAGPAEPGEEVAPPEVREPEAEFTLTPPPGPGGERRTGGPASQAQADLFGDRNETQQALADRNRQRDAARSGTDDVPAGIDGGLFSDADRQRDLVDATTAAPENEPDGEATNLPRAGQGAAGADTPAPAVDRDSPSAVSLGYGFSAEGEPAGAEYASQADLVEFRRQRLLVDRVRSRPAAALALAYLADGSVERLDGLVTDKDGKPLAVVGGYKGNVSSAAVYPEVLLSEAIGVEGAARIWLAHNHPSGSPVLSSADRTIAGRIEAVFKGSGIDVGGFLAIGAGASGRRRYQGISEGAITTGDISINLSRTPKGPEVPVLERRLQRTDKLGPPLSAPEDASAAAMKFSGGRPGLILLDVTHAPIAFVPVAPDVAGELRRDGRLAALYRAVARSPAAAAIVVNPDNKYSRQVADNLGGALQFGGLSMRVLDRIDLDTETGKGVSIAARGWEAASGMFARLADGPSPGLYSALTRAVEAAKQHKAPANQWKAWLNNQQGIKKEEAEWSGVNEWLDQQQGTVTREALAEFLRENEVQIQEVVLGSSSRYNYVGNEWQQAIDRAEAAGDFAEAERINRAWEGLDAESGSTAGQAKFGEYQTPGGENYRELLLTLPPNASLPDGYEARKMKNGRWGIFGPGPMSENRYGSGDTREDAIRSFVGHGHTGVFKSSHFDQPNIIAHVRFNERTGADGKRVLFIEEVQSDWHQAGRKKGYTQKAGEIRAARPGAPRGMRFEVGSGEEISYFASREEAEDAANMAVSITGVPNAPFKQSWPMLAMKRMIRYAADNGFDRIAWTTGEQQADRYDLSKHLSEVTADEYEIAGDRQWRVKATSIDGERVPMPSGYLTDDELADAVGKELAEKIISDGGGTYSGLDLKVGGEGMKAFYDRELRNEVGKYVKKWGAKVGTAEVAAGDSNISAHAIDITPTMREAAQSGQPMFRRIDDTKTGGTVESVRAELDAAFGHTGVQRLIDDGILQIVESRQALPADTLETMKRHFPGRTMGIYVPSTETAYIIGDEIEAGEAPRILLHEIGEHYGLERMLGSKAYGRLQNEVRALHRAGNPLVSTAWDQVARNYPHLEPGGETFVREVIAHVGEQADGLRLPFMQRVIQAVRRFLFSIGFHVKLRDAEIVGMVQASLRRTMSMGRGAGVDRSRQPLAAQAGRMGSQRSPSAGFPPVHRMARLGAMRDHADYAAAKAGDPEAAARVVADTLTVPGVQALRRALEGRRPRVVPVVAAEAGGRNALPRAYALALGELLGLEVETDIVQTVRAFHTNANAYQRIASQPVFDGRVEPGADYLIVDDTQAMGGTLANLRGHIEAAGGRVVLASALTGHETTADIGLRPDMRESLIAKHGQALDDYLNETFGFGIDALTQGEAGHLRAAPSLDVIRDRLTEARSSLGLTEDFGSPESEPPLFRLGETAEQREALRKAGLGLATKTQGERFTAGLSDRWNAFAEGALKRAEEGIFNRFAPIRDAERAQGKRDAQESAYVAARLSTGTSSTVTALLMFGHGEWRNGVIQKKAGTRGLLDLLEPVRGNLDAWAAWMVAKRAEYLRRQDRENNLTDADIAALKAVATDAGFDEATLEKVARDVRDFNTSVLRLAEGAGLLTAEQVKAYARDRYYIPFFREDEEGDPMRPFLRRGLSHQAAGIKALKGGRQALADPLANMLGNVSRLVDAALKNNAAAKAVTNLPQHFEELGKDADKSRAVRVMLGGEPRYFRALDPALMRAMAGFAPDRWPDGLAPFRTAKRLLTAGVTADPAFIIRNFIRDVLYSWAVSKDRFTPLVDSIKGVRSSLRQDEDTQAVMFAGASFLGGSQFGGDFDSAADGLRRAMSRKGFPKTAGETLAIGPRFWQMYRELGEAVENANRSAIFKAVNARGGTAAEAIFESKDLMDYSLSGSWTAVRLLADVVPFFNARLQGLYKLGRSLDQRQLYYAGTAIMAASLALLLVNHDDERWQALTNEDKDLFWHVFVGETHYRIPKPFEIGVMFGTVPERLAMQMLGQDARLGERAIWTLVETFALDPTPQFVKPAMEASFNYDTFRNAPIEGMADEGKLPEARFDTRTSETMVAIGQATGTSPKKLEHLWNAYLGSLGGYALDAVDALVSWGSPGEKADMTLRDVPVLGSFARSSQPAATRYSREMYELLREAEQVYRTVREYQRQGEIEAAEKLIADNKALLAVRPALNRVSRRMRDIRANMDNIRRDTSMSGAEKRRRLDQLETMLYAASRRAVTLAEEQGA